MSKFILNGKTYSGSTNYASSVTCNTETGDKSTVQDEIDNLKNEVGELNSNLGNRLTAFTVEVEATASSGVIGGFYGYMNLTQKIVELNLPIVMVFPVSATKSGENGVNGIVGKYNAGSVYSDNDAGATWTLSAPSAGKYVVTFIAVLV